MLTCYLRQFCIVRWLFGVSLDISFLRAGFQTWDLAGRCFFLPWWETHPDFSSSVIFFLKKLNCYGFLVWWLTSWLDCDGFNFVDHIKLVSLIIFSMVHTVIVILTEITILYVLVCMRVWVVPSVNWVLITSHDFVDLLLRKRNVLNHCLVIIARGGKTCVESWK